MEPRAHCGRMRPRAALLACLVLLPLLAAHASAVPPSPQGKLRVGSVCVDTTEVPPRVDAECRTSLEDVYEELCGLLDLCVAQLVIDALMEAQCGATGLFCDWRERTCLQRVFECGVVERADELLGMVTDTVVDARPDPDRILQ